MENAPVIFIHYGDAFYLKYTLKCVKLFNPKKRIILLGDEHNQHYSKLGIEHFYFEDFTTGKEIEEFDKVYQFIAGKDHGREYWTNFVFRRWFIMYNFITQNQIEHFWTFDSDNLIFTDLGAHEFKYESFDCTEQCFGTCMNGFISNLGVVTGYIEKMIEVFNRQDILDIRRKEYETHTNFAFTEMGAYDSYKYENKVNSIMLNTVINNSTFDDFIGEAHEMEAYDFKFKNRYLKKIYLASDGNIYGFHLPSKQFVQFNSLNLSCMYEYIYIRLYKHVNKKIRPIRIENIQKGNLRILDLSEPITMGILLVKFRQVFNLNRYRRFGILSKFKRAIKRIF